MIGKLASATEAVKVFLARKRHMPTFGQVLAFISILGLATLFYLLGAAVMFFQLPTYVSLHNAFVGVRAWSHHRSDPLPPAPTEPGKMVLIDKSSKTNDGFTLYTTNYETAAALIDMSGQAVHRWRMPWGQAFPQGPPDRSAVIEKQVSWFGCHLFPNGDLLAVYHVDAEMPLGNLNSGDARPSEAQVRSGHGLIKLDKNSKLLWSYAGQAHHALDVGDDGTIYALTHEKISKKPANMEYLPVPQLADSLVVLSAAGKLLQSIPILEALRDSPYTASMQVLISQINEPADGLHANSVMVLTKALAPRFPMFKEGQVLLSLRNMNTLAVLDVPTRSVVWAVQGAWRNQHDAAFLENGHLLLFDNDGNNRASRVLEYDPANQSLPWSYTNEDSKPFMSGVRGGSQRLPDGNTLFVNPSECRMLEVSAAKEVVWAVVAREYAEHDRNSGALSPSINWARRYPAERLTFLKAGGRPRP